VIQEIDLCGQYVHSIDDNLKHITFNVLDMCGRNHFIKINIPKDYSIIKNEPLYFDTIIPSICLNYLSNINTILELFKEFKRIVNELNLFWTVQEEIINTCNVIGSYTSKDFIYKIPIDYYVCLNVEVDPFNPMNCPKFVLHGQLKSIEKFQLRLNTINQILNWNSGNSFKENILNVFDITTLQSQYYENKQDHTIECTSNLNYYFICYDQLDITSKK